MHGLGHDIRYALRTLAGAPGFTVVAVLTLALSTGANIGIFSVVSEVLLQRLPYRDADRLVLVEGETDYVGTVHPAPVTIQAKDFDAWAPPSSVDAVALYAADAAALLQAEGAEVIDTAVVSPAFFPALGGA